MAGRRAGKGRTNRKPGTIVEQDHRGAGATRTAGSCSPGTKTMWENLDSRQSILAAFAVLATVTYFIFRKVIGFDFVNWDDELHVYQNPFLNHNSIHDIAHFWRYPYEGLYIPVSYTAFGLLSLAAHHLTASHELTGTGSALNPGVFHTANLVLHITNTALVFLLLRRLTKSDLPSCAGALLFALHPLQVESVAWISELRGLLAAFFTLLSLHFYLEYVDATSKAVRTSTAVYFALSLLSALLAMLAKPSSVIIGGLIFAIGIWECGRPLTTALKETACFVGVGLLPTAVTFREQDINAPFPVSIWLRPFVAGDTLTFYLWKLFCPLHLCIDYGRTPAWLMEQWWAYISWLVPVALCVLAFIERRRRPYIGFGLFVIIVGLLPVLGLVPFDFQSFSTTADRYFYMPMVGAALIISYALTSISNERITTAYIVFTCVLGLLGGISYKQTLVWRGSETLCVHALSVNPQSALAENNLAKALEDRGSKEAALYHYERAVTLAPLHTHYRDNLGILEVELGRLPQAETEFKQEIALSPSAAAYRNLGDVLAQENRNSDAVSCMQAALALDPADSLSSEWLGTYYVRTHNYPAALATFNQGVEHCPRNWQLWRYLGVLLYLTDHRDEALAPLERAAQLNPSDPVVQRLLPSLLSSMSQTK